MSLATYSDLKTTVANYLARTDLTTQIPDFIRFAELRLRRELRIRQMLKSVTTTTTSGDSTVALPSDFLEVRDFYVSTNPIQPLTFSSPAIFSRNTRSTQSGKPLDYTILASEFKLAPVPDSNYTLEMLYFAAPTFMDDSNSSNAFMANAPDALLYAALLEAEPYLMNDARINTWGSLYDRAITTLTKSDESSQYSGVPLSMSYATR
jgi:hypothetical protein